MFFSVWVSVLTLNVSASTPYLQLPTPNLAGVARDWRFGSWALGVDWELEIGSWEFETAIPYYTE
jgi:hypothetical protein